MKGEFKMKKILFTIAIVLTLGLTANAQGKNDGFFKDWDSDWTRSSEGYTPGLPEGTIGALLGNQESDPAPLGSGLLVLTALGAGYAVARKKSKK